MNRCLEHVAPMELQKCFRNMTIDIALLAELYSAEGAERAKSSCCSAMRESLGVRHWNETKDTASVEESSRVASYPKRSARSVMPISAIHSCYENSNRLRHVGAP
jgi:hypothetical protein